MQVSIFDKKCIMQKINLYKSVFLAFINKFINLCSGFSSATPWLQINDDYTTVNVAKQSDALNSHMKVYKELTKLRYSDSILYGDTKFYTNDTIFGFTRVKKGNPGYLVAVNFGKEEAIANATTLPLVPGSGTVQIRDSANNDDT